jgi:hypothetical protein
VRGYLNSLIGARSGFLNISESVNYYSWLPFQNLQRTGSFPFQRTGKGPTPGYFKIFGELPVFHQRTGKGKVVIKVVI